MHGTFPVTLTVLFVSGLSWLILADSSKTSQADQIAEVLLGAVVAVGVVGTWLAFTQWSDTRDVLAGRLALALPALLWASQCLSTPAASGSSGSPLPRNLGLGVGVVGTWLVACDVVFRERPLVRSLFARLFLAAVVSSAIAAAFQWAIGDRGLGPDTLRPWVLGFATVWAVLGIVELVCFSASRTVARSYLGVSLLALAISQLAAYQSLVDLNGGALQTTNWLIASRGTGLLTALLVTTGLILGFRQTVDAQRRQLLAAEFTKRQSEAFHREEKLTLSRKVHDQSAALLAIETVIRLLEVPENTDPAERYRLCRAATDELHRLRGDAPRHVETELRDLVEPVVAMANAAGGNIEMRVRPGLIVHAEPALVDVIRNLVSNALFHSGTTDVTVAAKRLDFQLIELSVTDKGRGIPAPRRFDLFEPGRSSGGVDRTGLGLHSARTLMRELGGELFLDRNYIDGARFVVHIPSANSTSRTPMSALSSQRQP